MSILEMARIDEKSLTKALLKSSGHDVAHVLAHLWASLKLKEIKGGKLKWLTSLRLWL